MSNYPIFLSRDLPLPKFKEPDPDQGKKHRDPEIEEDLNSPDPKPPTLIGKRNFKFNSARDKDKFTIAMNTSDWMFTQATALTSCPIEDFRISSANKKFINWNGNAWSNESLEKYYPTFIGGHNYYNHEQEPNRSYGFIVDAFLRPVGEVNYVDLLIATNVKKTPNQYVLDKITRNQINTMSMGCESSACQCSRCGKVYYDVEKEPLCSHLNHQMGSSFIGREGGDYTTAMIVTDHCNDPRYTGFIEFYEESWVDSPACDGAVVAYRINLPHNQEVFFEMPKASFDRELKERNGVKHWYDNQFVKIRR